MSEEKEEKKAKEPKKVKVKYVGSKAQMPVYAPVGSKPNKGASYQMVKSGEDIECSEEEAKKLIQMDSQNFKLDGYDPKKDLEAKNEAMAKKSKAASKKAKSGKK